MGVSSVIYVYVIRPIHKEKAIWFGSVIKAGCLWLRLMVVKRITHLFEYSEQFFFVFHLIINQVRIIRNRITIRRDLISPLFQANSSSPLTPSMVHTKYHGFAQFSNRLRNEITCAAIFKTKPLKNGADVEGERNNSAKTPERSKK